MDDDIVWNFDLANELIAIGTTRKLVFVNFDIEKLIQKYQNENEISINKTDDSLFSKIKLDKSSDNVKYIEGEIEKKIVKWVDYEKRDLILVTNDKFQIEQFKVTKSKDIIKINRNHIFKGMKAPIFSIDINHAKNQLAAISEKNEVILWDLKNKNILYQDKINMQSPSVCRYCFFTLNQSLIILYSSVRKCTGLARIECLENDNKYDLTQEIPSYDKQHSISFALSKDNFSNKIQKTNKKNKMKSDENNLIRNNEIQYLGLGSKSDISVYNLKNNSRIFYKKNAHIDPISSLDIFVDKESPFNSIYIASAGIDKIVNIYVTNEANATGKILFINYVLIFFMILFIAIIIYFYLN